jgi:hypothetical protein
VAVFRHIIRGGIGGGDIWMAGFCVQRDPDVFAANDDAEPIVEAFLTAQQALWTPTVTFDTLVTQEIRESDGKVLAVAESSLSIAGSSPDSQLPAEVAVCVSIRALVGVASGRYYLPAPSRGALTANGQMVSALRDDLADDLKTMHDAMAALTSPMRLGIYRPTANAFVGAGSINVGNVFDSQRRRRNKLVEARASRALLV